MAMKIRLARAGSKKRPFYRIVASDSRMPRDGRYIEKLGTYNPLLPKDDKNRIILKLERIKIWLEKGAKGTDRIQRILESLEILPKKKRNNPKKGLPGKAAQERKEKNSVKTDKDKEVSNSIEDDKEKIESDTENKNINSDKEKKSDEKIENNTENKSTNSDQEKKSDEKIEDS